MIYSVQVKKAIKIMYAAHKEDLDKGGYPYVFHSFYLATQMNDEKSVCVALLHDVVEDHGDQYSFETFLHEGFSDEIVEALKLLTHRKGVPYMDYIRQISTNELAKKVKIADLNHNLDETRVDGSAPRKWALYEEARSVLMGE